MAKSARFGLVIIGDEIISGKRQDRHLMNLNALLKPRGLALSWARIVGDEPALLVETLKQTFASGDVVFCCGGIGATPDDRTRQSAAKALGLPLVRHAEAMAEIEAQFGEQAYPQRVKMAEFPHGAKIIPNGFNRVPGFSIRQHYFMPGFPQMSQPMMAWVLDSYYVGLNQVPRVERAIRLLDGTESDWIEFMEMFEQRFPSLRLFSLPHISIEGHRSIELGVEGEPALADMGLQAIINELDKRQQAWEPI